MLSLYLTMLPPHPLLTTPHALMTDGEALEPKPVHLRMIWLVALRRTLEFVVTVP